MSEDQSEELPEKLAKFSGKGYVIAPAGYGKTHLIAMAVKAGATRQLILTHTHAGVHALKKKMQALGVPSSHYQIDTLASWALRWCLAFPATSDWKIECPQKEEWKTLYQKCTALLKRPFVIHVMKCSYAGLYVDEYQDCSGSQHLLVEALANPLPCRLLGDPQQAIFDFADKLVDWEKQVFPFYQLLGQLEKPWRWEKAGAPQLGKWLHQAREDLCAGKSISLDYPLSKGLRKIPIDLSKGNLKFLYAFLAYKESLIVIYPGAHFQKKNHLAKQLRGKFSSIEEVEGKDLFDFITSLETSETPQEKLCLVIEFAKKCCNSVGKILSSATLRGEHAKPIKTTKNLELLEIANCYLADPSSSNLENFMASIKSHPKTATSRPDLFNRLLKTLRIHQENPQLTLLESAHRYQRYFRHSGRPISHNKLIGTTLLVKGLEYDHAIILEADTMSSKELYVALTRGAKSITIVTLKNSIPTKTNSND